MDRPEREVRDGGPPAVVLAFDQSVHDQPEAGRGQHDPDRIEALRARRLRVEGSGAGSVSTQRMLAELPRLMELIADGTLPVAHMAYPLSRVGEAWAHHGRTRAVVVPD